MPDTPTPNPAPTRLRTKNYLNALNEIGALRATVDALTTDLAQARGQIAAAREVLDVLREGEFDCDHCSVMARIIARAMGHLEERDAALTGGGGLTC